MNLKIGEKVRYVPFEGCDDSQYERGKVKSLCDDLNYVFVVYHCNNEWDTGWQNYTAARTNKKDLILGW